VCRASDDEDADNVPGRRVSSRTTARLRRTSIPLFGQRKNNNNNDDSSEESGSVVSLHRDPLHRHNILTWRDNWQQATANRLPSADRNNNGIFQ